LLPRAWRFLHCAVHHSTIVAAAVTVATMTAPTPADVFLQRPITAMTIDDERAFAHVALYADLKASLRLSNFTFRIMPPARDERADRVLLLNLTFWGANQGGDVLVCDVIPADVVTHVAWHQLAARALPPVRADGAPSVAGLFLGEAIASAFDLYLVGSLLGRVKKSDFLDTQVPAMADAAHAAGLGPNEFAELLASFAADPVQAFSDLRTLLFDATNALYACRTVEQAAVALAAFDKHRFSALLHHYELSNWVLYARAYGDATPDARVAAIDTALRSEPDALAWLTTTWLAPVLASGRTAVG